MKKFLYVFIGIAIALGAVLLYSFKAKENAEVSYAIVIAVSAGTQISVFYDDGQEEDAEALLNTKIGGTRKNGQLPFHNAISKTLKHMSQKGYRLVGQSVNPGVYYYTLIKEN